MRLKPFSYYIFNKKNHKVFMMERIISLLVSTIIIITIFTGCSQDYSGWKTVTIENCGTINVPNSWVLTKKDGFIFFSDKSLNENR